MKYIDEHDGVWRYSETNGGHPWQLLSRGFAHSQNNKYKIDNWYTHKEARFIGLNLMSLQTGDKFDFPPEYYTGDPVWIDMDWLYANAVDNMTEYISPPQRIGGVVKHCSASDPSQVEITVTMRIPQSKITKR